MVHLVQSRAVQSAVLYVLGPRPNTFQAHCYVCLACVSPQEMVKKRTLPFVYDDSQPTRFGILPRYAQNEDAMRWFEVPAVMMFHVANAWQEGNQVKLFSCCFDQVRPVCPLLTPHHSWALLLTPHRSCPCPPSSIPLLIIVLFIG